MTEGNTGPILTLDRGNSTLDCMLWDARGGAGGVSRRRRLDPQDDEGLRRFLGSELPSRVVGLTVVDGGLEPARRTLQELGSGLLLAGLDLPVPLRVDYQDPVTLGLDRLVGAFAAHVQHGEAVVVDCGTALTVNLVQDGVFLGGAIAPGIDAMARALAASAPALPQVDLAADVEVTLPARSSQDAVNAGVRLGFRVVVDGLVAAVARAAQMTTAPHLLTGGRADLYLEANAGGGHAGFRHVPDLVHRGLRCLGTHDSSC